MKYEMIFGDPSQFEGMMPDCEFVDGNYGYKNNGDIFYYCERYNEKFGWAFSHKTNLEFKPIAMRRIIKEPKHWTLEDKKAGRLPDVGSKAVSVHGFCVVDILAVRNGCVVSCNSDISDARPCVFTIDNFLELYTPIESPEEKAARLRMEWCNEAGLVCSLGMTTLTRIYDALLSGELQAPKGE